MPSRLKHGKTGFMHLTEQAYLAVESDRMPAGGIESAARDSRPR
jgi:hypothetical protein